MKRTAALITLMVSAFAIPMAAQAQNGSSDGAQQAKGSVMLQVAEKQPLGRYLTDRDGRSLYMFEADSQGKSACYDACAEAWPPLLTTGTPTATEGTQTALVGTIERKDGAKQVTYDGKPLYYFVKDQTAGDTKGQDVKGFGAEWYLLSPQGEKIEAGQNGQS